MLAVIPSERRKYARRLESMRGQWSDDYGKQHISIRFTPPPTPPPLPFPRCPVTFDRYPTIRRHSSVGRTASVSSSRCCPSRPGFLRSWTGMETGQAPATSSRISRPRTERRALLVTTALICLTGECTKCTFFLCRSVLTVSVLLRFLRRSVP